jgi:hypothetical protein
MCSSTQSSFEMPICSLDHHGVKKPQILFGNDWASFLLIDATYCEGAGASSQGNQHNIVPRHVITHGVPTLEAATFGLTHMAPANGPGLSARLLGCCHWQNIILEMAYYWKRTTGR